MIQIDMEKPKGCNVCPFAVPHKKLLGFYVCLVNGIKFGQLTSSLYDWYEDRYFLECPLKEVKGTDESQDDCETCEHYNDIGDWCRTCGVSHYTPRMKGTDDEDN